jgi:CRP-like cAMP-binding protein
LLKIGKIGKVFKLLKLSKLKAMFASSDALDAVEDRLMNSANQAMFRVLTLVMMTFGLCHWIACLMRGCGKKWRLTDEDDELTYSYALYWAMMTLTTVGYGDVVPLGVMERTYTVLIMLLGGFFYGYIVGEMSGIIASRDLNTRAYYERMEQVVSWLAYHTELPKQLRRRIKKYFTKHLTQKAATDDGTILNDLSPSLMHDVSFFLVREEVRTNHLFHSLPNSIFSQIMPILENTSAEPDETLVSLGDPGTAMYFIIEGTARFEHGRQWDPATTHRKDCESHNSALTVGDTFGEEILLGFESEYHYTVVANVVMCLMTINSHAFENAFHLMPELVNKMKTNFVDGEARADEGAGRKKTQGRGSIIESHTGGMPQAFPDAVLDALTEIQRHQKAHREELEKALNLDQLVVEVDGAVTSQSEKAAECNAVERPMGLSL